MLGNALISLITNTKAVNALGDAVLTPTKTERQVYADLYSVGQSEFYQAAATGLKPEIKFEIMAIEYQNESQLEYNSKIYNIIRTYNKGLDRLELTCQGVVNG